MTGHSSPTTIVLCADDFGFTPAVSDGILTLVREGRLSAVSCMTNSPHFPAPSEKLNAFADRIDIGLHFVLTDMKPLTSMPSTVIDGRLPSFGCLVRKSISGNLSRFEIAAELERQIDVFIETFDRAPDFIDGHHHVHQLPGIRDVVLDTITERFSASLPWLRVCSESLTTLLRRRVSIGRGISIGWLGASMRKRAMQKGLQTNNGFSGIYDFSARHPYGELFERFITGIRPGGLIMCHPGHVDDILRSLDCLTDQRELELDYFRSDQFLAALRDRNLQLGRFGQSADSTA